MRRMSSIVALLLMSAAVPLAAAPVPDDTPAKTASGTTFTVPKAWSSATTGALVILTPPESDTHVAVVEVAGADATAASAAAWKLYRPDAKRPPKLVVARAARNGWDERVAIDYETSPNEKAAVFAAAYRHGATWTVFIVDASQATAEKRDAALYLIEQSLRPSGYARETFAGRTAHPLDPARVAAMRAFVTAAMGELGVPGVGMALIDHGKLVFEGGLGVRELGRPDPVGANTLFMIASNTKGMSTLLLAELVDAKKLDWDARVTDVYPAFRLGSAATTAKVRVRNLVCACTGLPRKDLEWAFNTGPDTPEATTFDQLAATEPTSGFGEVFQYNNLMASAAGYIGGHLIYPDLPLGAAYDKAMSERIFTPLGMASTTFDYARALGGDHASPHAFDADGRTVIGTMDFNYAIRPYRPAGGAWSSAHDLIRYVQNEITQGVLPDGTRLVSASALLARRAKSVPTGEDEYYGMGLEGDVTSGVTVIHHGGSMAGYKSDIVLVPDAQVGAVILTNSDGGRAMLRPFRRRLLELLYDGRPEAADDVRTVAKAYRASIAKDRERLVIPPAPAAVAALAPHYASPELGSLTVTRAGAATTFAFRSWSTPVASRVNDDGTTSFIAIDPLQLGTEFVVGTKDGKPALITRDGQHEYAFVAG